MNKNAIISDVTAEYPNLNPMLENPHICSASIQPIELTLSNILTVICSTGCVTCEDNIEKLITLNQSRFKQSDKISIILNGKSAPQRGKKEARKIQGGFLGDLLEDTRYISYIKALYPSKELQIITSEPSIFQDLADDNITCTKIDIASMQKCIKNGLIIDHMHPVQNPKYYKLMQGMMWSDSILLYPTLSQLPFWIEHSEKYPYTTQINQLSRELSKCSDCLMERNFDRGIVINKSKWVKKKIHQLNAQQIILYLLGIIDRSMPHQKLYGNFTPSLEDKYIKDYDDNKTPVLIHFETAGAEEKKYPVKKWKVFFDLLSSDTIKDQLSILLMEPRENCNKGIKTSLESYIQKKLHVIEYPKTTDLLESLNAMYFFAKKGGIIIGLDSMPAGHFFPNVGGDSIVIGNKHISPVFSSPISQCCNSSIVLLPAGSTKAKEVPPNNILESLRYLVNKKKCPTVNKSLERTVQGTTEKVIFQAIRKRTSTTKNKPWSVAQFRRWPTLQDSTSPYVCLLQT